MNSKVLPPRLPSLPARKSAVLSVLDIGTSKIVCLVARLNPSDPSEPLRGRTHRCRILGIGHQRSRGIKGGAVVDMDAAEGAIRFAVDAAERMAGVQVESVIVNATGGRLSSRLYDAKVAIAGRAVTQADVHRVLEACTMRGGQEDRAVLHALPIGFALGETRHIRDPRGMVGDELGADMHVLSCDAAAARNLMLAVERCHLTVDAMVATPYAAGLAALADDEAELGAALIDMGAGTTTIAVFGGGRFVYGDGFALGGHHVTLDLARGLNARIADAERIKTLYGSVLSGGSDERDMITIPPIERDDREAPQFVSRAGLVRIIKPRVEEMLEMVRDRLAASPFAAEPRGRVILTGGACQLTGLAEFAAQVLGRQVRIGRPLGIAGLPEEAKGPAFAVATGLLVYPQAAHLEHCEPRGTRHRATGTGGYISRVGRWLRESF